MADPNTLQFGPWAPDLQDNPVQVAPNFGAMLVPLADCMNVYYADGNYRCLPSALPIGPPVGIPVLNAYTYYDDVYDQEVIFAGLSGAIAALIDEQWANVPLSISASVQGTGLVIGIEWGGAVKGAGSAIGITLGSGIGGGQLLNATMVAGRSGATSGYVSGSYGSLTPTSDINGNAVAQLTAFGGLPLPNTILTMSPAGLGASYFTALNANGITLLASAATYSTSGGISQWKWPTNLGFNSGSSYNVVITL